MGPTILTSTKLFKKDLGEIFKDFDAAGHCTAFIKRGISSSSSDPFLKPSSGACSGITFSRAEFASRFFWRRVADTFRQHNGETWLPVHEAARYIDGQ